MEGRMEGIQERGIVFLLQVKHTCNAKDSSFILFGVLLKMWYI